MRIKSTAAVTSAALMSITVFAAILVVGACVGDRLAVTPPSGVDLSGQWKLNEADSDSAQHLAQAANGTGANSSASQGGRGRGRGGSGQGSGGGPGGPGVFQGPIAPSIRAMSASLRWPGNALEIKQVGGVVAFTSDGRNRVCQPGTQPKKRRHEDDPRDRDSAAFGRDAPPPICGWSERTLVVRGGDSEDDRPAYEQDYNLSEDGMRLIEVVFFKGGRSDGFTLSRVWDRTPK